ncbi:DUF4890 domain-containing protein [Pontibacter arcticus]|nr:DUF4890 domain-containing protein [Pontibacter arcticus]
MKKILAMLAMGVLVSGASFAQDAPQKEKGQHTEHRQNKKQRAQKSPEERATKRTEHLVQKLDLNKSQQRKLQALHLKQAQERQQFMAQRGDFKDKSKADRSKMREIAKTRQESYKAELKDILNKKQYAQYEVMQQEQRARYESKKGDRKEHRGERKHQRQG